MSAKRATNRIYQASDALLFSYPIGLTTSAPQTDYAPFIVTTPSARAALKLSIIFWQQITGQPNAIPLYMDATLGGAIQNGIVLQTADRNAAGGYTATGNLVGLLGPSRTLFNHTYQRIPVDTNGAANVQTLGGYSYTIQDSQDAIVGVLQNLFLSNLIAAAHGMNISLRARWEASGSDICEDEWAVLVSRMLITAPQTKFYT